MMQDTSIIDLILVKHSQLNQHLKPKLPRTYANSLWAHNNRKLPMLQLSRCRLSILNCHVLAFFTALHFLRIAPSSYYQSTSTSNLNYLAIKFMLYRS